MPEVNTDHEPYFLADKIYARASFTAELLKFYPHAPTELDMTAMWALLEDIAADAKKVMQALDPAKALAAEAQA